MHEWRRDKWIPSRPDRRKESSSPKANQSRYSGQTSIDLEQLDLKLEGGIRRDYWGETTRAVCLLYKYRVSLRKKLDAINAVFT